MPTASVPGPVGDDAVAADPFQALGDANRQRIVELLADGPRSVTELADAMPISRPAISRHLRLLKDAGLVAVTPDGTRRIYRLDDQGVEVVGQWLERMWGGALSRFRLVAENTTPGPERSGGRDVERPGGRGRPS